jgi:hypothetical protein
MRDKKIMDMLVEISKEVLELKVENRSLKKEIGLKKEIERYKEISESNAKENHEVKNEKN